ncbi:MAG: carboxypeptidase-like regulatory domain-containing protein [Saprospiraceae bacterium]
MGTLKGKVADAATNEPIPDATIILQGATLGGTTDSIGDYNISDIPPNLYNINASSINRPAVHGFTRPPKLEPN